MLLGPSHILKYKKAQLSLTNPRDAKAGPKIAPIRRAYNVVADNTGLSSCV